MALETLTPVKECTTRKKPRAVVIVSGGIDSVVALHWADVRFSNEVRAIGFYYGQRHKRELFFAQAQCDKLSIQLEVVSLLWLPQFKSSALTNLEMKVPNAEEVRGQSQPLTYVPFRNLLFLTIAAQFAEDLGAEHVVYGAQHGDLYGYWDCTDEFVSKLNDLWRLNRLHTITLNAPLSANSKAMNIRLGTDLGVDFRLTYSCYEGRALACGRCPTCVERKNGFLSANIEDPTVYEHV